MHISVTAFMRKRRRGEPHTSPPHTVPAGHKPPHKRYKRKLQRLGIQIAVKLWKHCGCKPSSTTVSSLMCGGTWKHLLYPHSALTTPPNYACMHRFRWNLNFWMFFFPPSNLHRAEVSEEKEIGAQHEFESVEYKTNSAVIRSGLVRPPLFSLFNLVEFSSEQGSPLMNSVMSVTHTCTFYCDSCWGARIMFNLVSKHTKQCGACLTWTVR